MNKFDELLTKMQEATPQGTTYNLNDILKELGLQNKDQLLKCIELAQNAKKQNKNPSVLDKFKNKVGNAMVNAGQKLQNNQQ
jgi:hypothetical protein